MSVDTLAASPPGRGRAGVATHILKLLAGAAVFAGVLLAPIDFPYEGKVVLATFACATVWWITQPLPWVATSLLPLVVFPVFGAMNVEAAMQLYGQPIFFWMMGTVLMGYALQKHGLARRVGLRFMTLPGVGGRIDRLVLVYMAAVACMSAFVSDTATIAMMTPIGMLLVGHARSASGAGDARYPGLGATVMLGTLYAAVAGGAATIMGLPHNAIVVSVLGRLTGRQLGFFEWMAAGLPVSLALLASFYLTLRMMVTCEVDVIPGGGAYLRAERDRLGPFRPDERRVLLVFALMVVLFVLPGAMRIAVGAGHPLAQWTGRALSPWVVPPAVLLLLFAIRSAEEPGRALLTWKDAEAHTPWAMMLLATGATGMTDALGRFGFVDLVGSAATHLAIGATSLPYIAAATIAVGVNFISGGAAMPVLGSVFIPAAAQIGYNPASIAILLANVAIGFMIPWSGAAAATAFASGEVSMRQMLRVGTVATAVSIVVVATVHLLLARFV